MKIKRMTCLLVASSIVAMESCQPSAKESQNASTVSTTMATNQNIKPVESGFADVNGLQLYYEVYGEGKPLVLLHGSYMPIPLNWSHIIPRLAKDRKVIATEMQGHGRTRDTAREFSYENMGDDVAGLLRHLNIDQADIMGYSMGGCLTFQIAVRHPEQVRRLVAEARADGPR